MKKFARLINETTKECEVGLGTNEAYYLSIGMTEQEVEEAWNGAWYLAGYAPEKPEDVEKQEEIYRLKDELAATDYKIIKCSEYSLAGQTLPYDIAELHARRQALRDRINELEG